MEEQKKKRFSGDSFGNLDTSNAEPEMKTEIAVPTGITGERPHYRSQELKDDISVVAANPFLKNTDKGDEKLDKQTVEHVNKLEEASNLSKVTPTLDLQGVENIETSEYVSARSNLVNDTLEQDQVVAEVDDLSPGVALPDPAEPETLTLENGNANEDINSVKEKEINQEAKDIQECFTERTAEDTQLNCHQDGDTARTAFSDLLEETGNGVDKEQEFDTAAEEENSGGDDSTSGDNAGVDEEDDGSDCLLLETPTRPQTRSTLREVPGGMRAKANTPASLYTNTVEGLDSPGTPQALPVDSVRGASRGSRDEVFQRAMTLMSNRCTSARGEEEELFSDREPPFGVHIPQYFYVQQSKPSPMSPLKVWRGYKGNVYFEPINVRRINSAHGNSYSSHLERVASEQARQSVTSSAGPRSLAPTRPLTRATTAASGQALRSYRYIEPVPSTAPQVFVMDKQAVVNAVRNSGVNGGQTNKDIQRDLHFIEGMESTGSLAIRPMSGSLIIGGRGARVLSKSAHHKDRKLLYKRDRLCKGPNFSAIERRDKEINNNKTINASTYRKASTPSTMLTSPRTSSRVSMFRPGSRSAGPGLRLHRMSMTLSHQEPNLVVSGDKFAPPTVMSPLLRSTGQFSLAVAADEEGESGRRAAANSPDLVDARGMMLTMAMSPSMDPLRISMPRTNSPSFENTDNHPAQTANGAFRGRTGKEKRERARPKTCSEELKPFIKYSHDVKMNYERNNVNYC